MLAAQDHRVLAYCWDRGGGRATQGDDGIRYVPVAVSAPNNTNRLSLYLPRLYCALASATAHERIDVIHCTHLALLPCALWLARKRRAKVVYDAYEFYALDIAQRFGPLARLVRMILERVEHALVSRVDGVITIDSREGSLARRYRRGCANVEVLFNVPDISIPADEHLIAELARRYRGCDVLIYAGGVFQGKGANQFVNVLSAVRERRRSVKLLVLGESHDGSVDRLRSETADGVRDSLELLGWVDYRDLVSYLAVANVALALHQPSEPRFWQVGRGNGRKIFDYMRAGLPIIAPAFMEVGQLVAEEGCGYAIDTTDAAAIAAKVVHLLDHPAEARAMGERGRRAVAERYNWSVECDKVLRVYQRLGLQEGQHNGAC